MQFGQFEINTFVEQSFKLDGGNMFGVVPKVIWQKLIPADENNLIPMVTNLFVLKAHGKNILFDSGLGDNLTEREKKVYNTDGLSKMEQGLKDLGLTPDDIDYVILTHLHTDHSGGAVKMENGRYVPRFGKAQYIIGRKEWNLAINPDERTKAVYIPERLLPLQEAGQVTFIEGDTEIFEGVRAVFTGGHTSSHFALEIESGGTSVFYYADIFPTSHHMKVAYVAAADLYPMDTMEIKRKTLPRIIDKNVIMAFDHDIKFPLAKITEDRGKYIANPVQALSEN